MHWEVEVRTLEEDREGRRLEADAAALGVRCIGPVETARLYLLAGGLTRNQVERIARELLTDITTETYSLREAADPAPAAGAVLQVLLRPGVMDPCVESIQHAIADMGLPVPEVRTGKRIRLKRALNEPELATLAGKVLANDAIEQVLAGPLPAAAWGALGREYKFERVRVPLREMTDSELAHLSRQGQLSLSQEEMRTIRDHFRKEGRDPTDVEIETIAQTWSEHCSHKTLKGRIEFTGPQGTVQYQNLLRETVFQATQEIRRRLGKDDWCVSVFADNAGIIRLDDRFHACFKVETHNHPSAIEPYGGANTGLGGVIRDVLGTGLGGQPICSTDVFCFGPPDAATLPPGVLHPRRVFRGVVAGVRDYGNRMGIPTVQGAICFDDRYLGNPLVFCGTIGLIPVGMEKKSARPGDLIVCVGGRTGRDGIHGATFSSAGLTHQSEETSGGAVQIGNAITEKKLLDVILAARDRGLYHAITDCGAGGFSSAVGEMGAEIGAEVHLERAPLKYAGLSYTEIWISESQERMILAVPPETWAELERLCASEDVEATVLGEFKATGRLVLFYQGNRVGDLAMHFLHEGRPPVVRKATWRPPPAPVALAPRSASGTQDLLHILASLNVCSKEWVIRQYDHEVQGGSVVKPLVGVRNDGPSDAAVIAPVLGSTRGLAVACGINPRYGDLDPYRMAASAIDEAVRNVVAVGADSSRIAILDNFCWGNTDRPETLGSLVLAAEACRDVAIAYSTPFISGKDSLNNEFHAGDVHLAIPPTLLISAMGIVPDVRRCVTMDFKKAGNRIYLLGETKEELGGSHYHLVRGLTGGVVPGVNLAKAPRIFRALHVAIQMGLVAACHDLSEGGLAVALAEMCFAGGLGASVDLRRIAAGNADDLVLLFSESNTRFLVEVSDDAAREFANALAGLPLAAIGSVTREGQLVVTGQGGKKVIEAGIDTLREAWQRPLSTV